MAYEPETNTPSVALPKNPPTRRELAWELLKQTRNPQYVAARYEFPLETMERALEKIPESKKIEPRGMYKPPARSENSSLKRASELIPEMVRSREPGEDDE